MTEVAVRGSFAPPVVDPERVVLGAMMSAGFEVVVSVAERLEADDFASPVHGVVFDAVCDLRASGGPTDALAVWDELRRRAELEGAAEAHGVTVVYLHDCVFGVPDLSHLDHHVGKVVEASVGRRVRGTLASGSGDLAKPGTDAVAVAERTAAALSRIVSGRQATRMLPVASEEAFWSSRPALRHVREFARARMASPWAVLGVVLVRVLSQVPPSYVLPATIGGHASLNLFAGVVAPSGGGKGAAMDAARDAFDVGDVNVWPVGTGEGLVKTFVHFDSSVGENGELVQHEESVVVEIHEVDQLGAVKGRQGATILSVLRNGWKGEEIGFNNADPTRRLKVSGQSYRLGLVVGVQPGRAEVLLNEAETAGGTPQRFLWVPGTDPGMPEVTPPEPKPRAWEMPPWPADVEFTAGRHVVDVCPPALATVRAAHRKRQRGDADALDGHALLCRLKVAAALGLLDGHVRVTEHDWTLAGTVMEVSDRTRRSVVEALRQAAAGRNRDRAEADAERAVIVSDRTEGAALARACEAVMRCLHRADGWVSHSDLTSSARRHRAHLGDAVEHLVDVGRIEVEAVVYQGQPGRRYRRVQ